MIRIILLSISLLAIILLASIAIFRPAVIVKKGFHALLMFAAILVAILIAILSIKRIPLGTILGTISKLSALTTIILTFVNVHYTRRSVAEPKFNIDCKAEIHEYLLGLSSPNSVRIYPIHKSNLTIFDVPAFRVPPRTLANVILITNIGEIAARNVVVRLRLKDPFIFVHVWFYEDPSEWRITFDETYYQSLLLETFRPIGRETVEIFFSYTYPKVIEKPDRTKALKIDVESASMKGPGESKQCSLDMKYWEKAELS
jgi:hypothetical protein